MKFLENIELNPEIKLQKGKEYPFVEMANVSTDSREPINIETKIYGSGVKFEENDTVIARIEPCIQNGKKFYCKGIEKGFGSTEFLVFRPKNNSVDSKFLYYFLQSEYIRKTMIASMTGATGRQRVNNDIFNSLEINIPNIKIQKKIAETLSTYDDLIENNQKQIKLLEEAAQRLYKEWFIDLHFPGYENVKIIDGIPEGWENKTINDLGDIVTGKTPSTEKSAYYGGNIPFVKIPDMHDNIYPFATETSLTKEGADTQRSKYIPKDSVMVSCIGTVGLVSIAVKECQTNQQINSIILKNPKDLYYTYFLMKGIQNLLDGVGSNGATMTNVNKGKFANINIIHPNEDLVNQFYNFSTPVFNKIFYLSKQTMVLKEARDLLLPKLMNGGIEV